MPDTQNRLKYLTTGELREEIAYTVGADPTRYGAGTQTGLLKNHLQQVAITLQPPDTTITIENCDLEALYRSVCDWAGCEYNPNSGNVWKINRDNLKHIHRALDATAPRNTPKQ